MKRLFILCVILIPVLLVYIVYSAFFMRKLYVTINAKNQTVITNMMEKNEIAVKGEMKRIGIMQGLGDWYLYLEYKDGKEESIILKDGEAADLHQYISQRGSNGSDFAVYGLGISILVVVGYMVHKIYHNIHKKEDEMILKE